MRSSFVSIALVLCCCSAFFETARCFEFADTNAASWASFGGSRKNTRSGDYGILGSSTLNLGRDPDFYFLVNSSVTATPAIIEQLVIFPTSDGWVYAYGMNAYELVWKRNVNDDYYRGSRPGARFASTPVHWRKSVILGTDGSDGGSADLFVLDAYTGDVAWNITLSDTPGASLANSGTVRGTVLLVAVSFNGTEYDETSYNSFVGSFHCIDLLRGRSLWNDSWTTFPTSLLAPLPPPGPVPAPPRKRTEDGGATNARRNSKRDGWYYFSGGSIEGSSPPTSTDENVVYFTTGPPFLIPDDLAECFEIGGPQNETYCYETLYPDAWFNSLIGLDVYTGKLVLGRRFSAYSSWIDACQSEDPDKSTVNCPIGPNYDFRFLMAPSLARVSLETDVPIAKRLTEKYFVEGEGDGDDERRRSAISSSETAIAESDVLYFAGTDGVTWCVDASDFETIWSIQSCPGGPLGGHARGSSLGASGDVYLSCVNRFHQAWTLSNGTVTYCGGWVALDGSTGAVKWSSSNPACSDPSGGPFVGSSNGRASTAYAIAVPVAVGDILLVGSTDTIYFPDAATGVPTSGNGGGSVYTLSASNGHVLSSRETGGAISNGFSTNVKCAFTGNGFEDGNELGLSSGTGVRGWCVTDSLRYSPETY